MNELLELEVGVLTGVTKPTIDKILKVGIHTVEDLARQTPKNLAERGGMGKDTAENAIEKALNLISRGYITGKQLHEEMKDRTRLSTGSNKLDELLGGGIESETITEISGKEGSGKTQLCHMLSVLAQLPLDEGGLNGSVVWVDTEATFRPDRIIEICNTRELDPDEMLLNILCGKAFTSQHQKMRVEELGALCHKNNIKLIIIDSMISLLRSEYLGRAMLAERQILLNEILQRLGKICQTYKITAVYTNQVMDDPGQLYGNPEKAVGGHIMGHAATTRIHIKKGRQGSRIAALVKSPYLPDGQAPFIIDEYGIRDIEKFREEEDIGTEEV